MDLFDEKIDELLAKHLAGECSPEEEEAIGRWLAETPAHQKYLTDLHWLWERSPAGFAPAPRTVDTEAALRRVKSRLTNGSGSSLFIRRNFWMQAAAALALAVATVYWWRQGNTHPQPLHIAAAETAVTDTLTDGSVVTLEQASGLTLDPAFNRRERRMRLQGQAFFQVVHDTVRPFVVEVQELQVRVVGTAFTVDNVTDPAKITVAVTEGKVLVRTHNQTLLLTPGEQAVYDRPSAALTRSSVLPGQTTPGKTNRLFRFDATPLDTVVRQVAEAYGVQITFKNKSLGKCRLTARYNNLPLQRVLELIADSFSIAIEKSNSGYVLDGQGCESIH